MKSCRSLRFLFAVLILLVPATAVVMAEDNATPAVGMTGRVEQVILPGPELVAMGIEDKLQPVVVRLVAVFPHGDSFRYDIEFQGMVPGNYDLTRFLKRKDGSDKGTLPEVPVTVRSHLPEGQIEPNTPGFSWWPKLGGYRSLAIVLATLWFAGLVALITAGRKKKRRPEPVHSQKSFEELLRERVALAARGELTSSQRAELERMLIERWRRELGLIDLPIDEAIRQIRDNPVSGKLIHQLERWLHSPEKPERINIEELIEPCLKSGLEVRGAAQ